MELFTIGFETALSATNLFYCFLGVFLGMLIGVLPGVGPLAAITLLLPVSFYLDPTTALVMLGGVYYGAEYGGSTASILLNLPGTTASVVTCLDGYPMARQGRAGVALFMTTIASFLGGSLGILILSSMAPNIARFAVSFGAAEYFAAILLGLIASATVSRGAPIKGLAMVNLGVMLGMVGTDVNSGMARYTLGLVELFDGFTILVIAMGLFGVSEVLFSVETLRNRAPMTKVRLRDMVPTREDLRRSWMPILRGGGIGSILGALPGTGPSIASFLSYAVEKRISKRPQDFGTGIVEGVSAPESANNAAAQTAFIPTLSLGIPGSATMAIMLGALMVHGIPPGPRLVSDHPELFWGLVASFWIGNVVLLILNIPMIGIWVSLLRIPYRYMFPAIIALICVGTYSVHYSTFDVGVVLAFGVIGYVMRMLDFEPAPLLIGFVLGPLLEENFRRAMLIANGDVLRLFERPIAGTLLVSAGLLVLGLVYLGLRQRLQSRRPVGDRPLPETEAR